MIRGLYTAASGMITKQVQMENLSNNISNINTPGYKKDDVSLKSFEEHLLENYDRKVGNKNFKNTLGTLELGVGINETKTNFTQGIIEATDRNLDFAINGEGFFTLMDTQGNEKYTRDGNFVIDSNGYLTSVNGEKVLGLDEYGIKREIKINKSDFELKSDGRIDGSDNNLKFCISNFANNNDLKKGPNNIYTSDIKPIVSGSNGNVVQKSLEKSNVDTIESITTMISIMRNYESNQKVLQQIDDALGKTVNEVGSVR